MLGDRSRLIVGVAAATLVALLAGLGLALADSQSSARRDVRERFHDRAKASAALTSSLFSSTSASAQAENARRYGAARVSSRALATAVDQSSNRYALILSMEGRVIAASPGTPAAARRSAQSKPPYIRRVLAGTPFALSEIQDPGRSATLGYAQAFETRFGKRVLVTGLKATLISGFLGGSLERIPNVESGRAYVLDRSAAIIASPDARKTPGTAVSERGLREALAKGDQGRFGDTAFTSDAVEGTPWRVVLTAPAANLFAPVDGAGRWIPWVLLIAFGLAAAFALGLLRRALRSAARLDAANAELATANQSLEQKAAEVSRSNEQLERFASIASHDLQEPLRKIQTFAERLTRQQGEELSESSRDYLARMSAAARRMQALIDDLLAFSRITSQATRVEQVELEQLAAEVLVDLEAAIEQSGATVEVGRLPTVQADPLRMQQLLQNLLANAVKFGREGVPPVVRVHGRVDGDHAEVTISDNGIGFDPQYAGRIFRVFERLHGRDEYPGTGIGLALCRRIVERHGGTIWAEGIPGEGATFRFTLPLQSVDVASPSPPPTDRSTMEPLTHA